ncbi:MAG: hypothetical protein RR416_05780 [Clostridia bacterium]
MRYLDAVRVVTDKYEKYGIKKGDIGDILCAEIRDLTFCVFFEDENGETDDGTPIFVGDLELVEDRKIRRESILKDLPNSNIKWWCIVEDGYIKNLLGEKKNKIPYDYNS